MRNKFLLLFIAIVIYGAAANAANYYVAPTGSDSNNGSTSTPFATIQKAVDMSTSGSDIIYVKAGTYNQAVNISGKSGITLTRNGSDVVYVQGSSAVSTTIISIANSSNITVSYLYIQNMKANWAKGIEVIGAGTNIQIIGNKVNNINYKTGNFNASDVPGNDVGANPIAIVGDNENSSLNNILISGNEVYTCMTGWSEAIALKGNVDNFNVEKNIVHDITNIGIDAFGIGSYPVLTKNYQVRNGVIQQNTTYNCKCNYTDNGAIYVDGGKDISIVDNKVYNNIYGITIGCENQMNIANGTTSGIHVRNNFVYNNTKAGIMIGTNGDDDGMQGTVTNSDVMGNTFLKNSTSDEWGGEVVLQNSTNISVSSNIFYGLFSQMFTYNLGTSGIVFKYNDYYYVGGSSGSMVISQQTNSTTWTGISLSQFQSLVGGDPGSIFANPSMVSDVPSNSNFHINTGSPCVNAGDPSYIALSGGEFDMDLTSRIASGRIDMGCDETGAASVAVTGVTMSPTTASIAVGATQQLTATVAPSNASNKSVTWSSSNTAVATVNTSGLVTAVAAGSATITVTTVDGGFTATCATTVTTIAVTGVTMSPTTASISVGGTQQLTATVAPTNATNKNVTWSSSNTAIATVSSAGMVTAVAAGTATITVTTVDGARTATCTVTVTAVVVPTLTAYYCDVDAMSAALPMTITGNLNSKVVATSAQYTAIANSDNSRWTTSNPGTGDEVFMWLESSITATGITSIDLSFEGYLSGASANFSIWARDITNNVWVQMGTTQSIATGTDVTVTRSITSNISNYVSAGKLIWGIYESTSAQTLNIDKVGIVVNTGTTVPVTGVTLSPTTASVTVGSTQQLNATIAPSNATNKNVTWSSSNTSVATVNSTGLVTAVAAGSATITVTTVDGAKTATCAITVSSGGGAVTITIDGSLSDWSSVNAIATATGQTCTSLKVYDDDTYFYFGIAGSGMDVNYQLWLNTDNNTATGYNDWNYTSSGADYMVENGNLRQSTGTGWSWNELGTVTASKSATVTEVRIPRSLLGTLASTIKVAYSDVNSSWSVVSKLGYASYTKLKNANIINDIETALSPIGISVYPNPASNLLNIDLGEGPGLSTIAIFGMDGRLIYKDQTYEAKKEIHVNSLNTKGLVLIQINKNGQVSNFKMVLK